LGVTLKRFEDLECWQEARSLTRAVYHYTKGSEFSKDFRLSGQITGASISIMNNISEGFDSRSGNEFVRFLSYSRRSCSEVQNCLYIALDQEYVAQTEFELAYNHCMKVRKMIDGLIRYLRKNNKSNRPTG
jgi:four helix bundle protein